MSAALGPGAKSAEFKMKMCAAPQRDAHFSKVSAALGRGAGFRTICDRGHSEWTFFVLKVRGREIVPRRKKAKPAYCVLGVHKT